MLHHLRQLLQGPEAAPETLDETDAQVAVAAILVEAARADGHYEVSERNTIDRVLTRRFGIGERAAAEARPEGEALQAEASDIVRFTRAIKATVPHDERVGVVEALWEVIYADGMREAHESALMRRLAGLLYVEDREIGLARQRVAERLGHED